MLKPRINKRNVKMTYTRGPLKAISNILNDSPNSNNENTKPRLEVFLNSDQNCKNSTPIIKSKSENSIGPFVDRTNTAEIFQDLLPIPLRSSSRRFDMPYVNKSPTNSEDIRRHFPVKGFSTNPQVKISENGSSTDASRKRAFSTTNTNLSENFLNNETIKLNNNSLTMGADVKTHPRYYRRKSAQSIAMTTTETPDKPALGPICSVPMPPSSFVPSTLNRNYKIHDSNSLCNLETRSEKRTIETQTTPEDMDYFTDRKRKTRRLTGHGSGTIHVIHNLKRTFGFLRRAISADRLNTIHNKSQIIENNNSNTTEADNVSPNNKPAEIQSLVNFPFNSNRSSLCSLDRNDSKPSSGYTLRKSNFSSTNNRQNNSLQCEVVRHNADGSVQVVLRRSSVLDQFGFFIAKDSKGIYVSRLGSVKSAAKLWDSIKVGDRILEVQNISAENLQVEQIRNLIRGCELVEMRIKSFQKGS